MKHFFVWCNKILKSLIKRIVTFINDLVESAESVIILTAAAIGFNTIALRTKIGQGIYYTTINGFFVSGIILATICIFIVWTLAKLPSWRYTV